MHPCPSALTHSLMAAPRLCWPASGSLPRVPMSASCRQAGKDTAPDQQLPQRAAAWLCTVLAYSSSLSCVWEKRLSVFCSLAKERSGQLGRL